MADAESYTSDEDDAAVAATQAAQAPPPPVSPPSPPRSPGKKKIVLRKPPHLKKLEDKDGKLLGMGGNTRRGVNMLCGWVVFAFAYVLASVLLANFLAGS